MNEGPILVCTDLSDSSVPALEKAASAAAASGRSVLAVHVIDPHAFISSQLLIKADDTADTTDRERRELERLVSKHMSDVDVTAKIIEDPAPVRAICDLAADENASVIVIASHGRTGWNRIMIGSVAERVVRHAPCDVWVVRGASSS